MIQADSLSHYTDSVGFTYPEIRLDKGESLLVLVIPAPGNHAVHLLAGLLHPQSGEVRVGQDNVVLSNQGDRFRGKNIGIIFQQPYFVKSLNVEQNLKVAQSMAGNHSDISRINELLSALGLEGRNADSIGGLSTGELQRVSIARALINKPEVVLADEPTASLDDGNCSRVIVIGRSLP